MKALTSRIHRSAFASIAVLTLTVGLAAGCAGLQKGSDVATGSTALLPVADHEILFQPEAVNSPEAQNAPYVILVSIDGYRWDYNKMFGAKNLTQLAQAGVQADSLRPVYPSKTFPNHYSIVTGMTAAHHGIVSNEFYDAARDATYSLPDRKAVEDGSWYFGEPLWVTAGREGMISASYFWVGSEADIEGAHPNHYFRYDSNVPYETRVDQVVTWLHLAPEKRPHFITLYFEGVDEAAHRYGVNTPQVREAVQKVDQAISRLREGVKASGLPVNIVVVSDHGMQDLDAKKVITLDESPEVARVLAKFQAVGRGPQMLLYLNKGEPRSAIDEAYVALNQRANHFRVFRRSQMTRLNYASTPRVGDLVIDPDLPYSVGLRGHMPNTTGANHGWDPARYKSMHGIFIATGPSFKEKAKLPTFDNIHIYPLLLQILGLKQRVPADGQLDAVRASLRDETKKSIGVTPSKSH